MVTVARRTRFLVYVTTMNQQKMRPTVIDINSLAGSFKKSIGQSRFSNYAT